MLAHHSGSCGQNLDLETFRPFCCCAECCLCSTVPKHRPCTQQDPSRRPRQPLQAVVVQNTHLKGKRQLQKRQGTAEEGTWKNPRLATKWNGCGKANARATWSRVGATSFQKIIVYLWIGRAGTLLCQVLFALVFSPAYFLAYFCCFFTFLNINKLMNRLIWFSFHVFWLIICFDLLVDWSSLIFNSMFAVWGLYCVQLFLLRPNSDWLISCHYPLLWSSYC